MRRHLRGPLPRMQLEKRLCWFCAGASAAPQWRPASLQTSQESVVHPRKFSIRSLGLLPCHAHKTVRMSDSRPHSQGQEVQGFPRPASPLRRAGQRKPRQKCSTFPTELTSCCAREGLSALVEPSGRPLPAFCPQLSARLKT